MVAAPPEFHCGNRAEVAAPPEFLPLRPNSIAWNDLRFSDADAPDSKNFVPACAFVFYIPELPTKYPEVSNALHNHLSTKNKGPMKATDFENAPISFDENETDWFNANVEVMVSRLSEEQPGSGRSEG